ncbi:MAG TPA: heavy metal-associated domain-containing protein, partial [Fodinibius sp.]|nr:heavy metal-associated domain-containing protein [Fodinibius sp.]
LRSDELSCPSCISNIESNLNNMEGVEKATVHFSTGRIEVAHDTDMVFEQDLVEAVRQSGYESYISAF